MHARTGVRFGLAVVPLLLAATGLAVFLAGVDDAPDEGSTAPPPAAELRPDGLAPLEGGGPPPAEEQARLDPDGLYPDLRLLPMTDVHLDVVTLDGSPEVVVRFTTTIVNVGQGPLELSGRFDEERGTTVVSQHVYGRDGREVATFDVGEFVYHGGHEHWHVEGFVAYRLYALDGDGEPLGEPLSNRKTSFCVTDDEQAIALHRSPPAPAYLECNDDRQGISVGWSDIYFYDLVDQWIVVGDELADGDYVLVGTVAPDGLVRESDAGNNSAAVSFSVRDGVLLQ